MATARQNQVCPIPCAPLARRISAHLRPAYESFVKLYNIVGTISHDEFQKLVDIGNTVSQLLLSHFLAAHILLRHVSVHEMTTFRSLNDPTPMYNVMISWMQNIDNNLPASHLRYNDWPRRYVSEWSPILASGHWRPQSEENEDDHTLFKVL